MVEQSRSRPRRSPRQRLPSGLRGVSRTTLVFVLAGVIGVLSLLALTFNLVIGVIVVAVVSVLGVDFILRNHPRGDFRGWTATALYVSLPALFAIAAVLFVDKLGGGVWNVVGAVIGAFLFSFVVNAEYVTVEGESDAYAAARFALSLASYLIAFAIFTVIATAGLSLVIAIVIAATLVFLLSIDTLREQAIPTTALLAFAAAIAVVIAQVRWAAYYLAMPDFLAGGLLLITFYVATGLTQSATGRFLDRRTYLEYGVTGLVGVVIIGAVWLVWRGSTG